MVRPRNRGPSLQEIRLLGELLAEPDADHYGLDLGKRIGVLSGTIYPLLRRLEDRGWLESSIEDVDPARAGRPARRLYRLTGEGVAEGRRVLRDLDRTLAPVRPRTV